MNRMSLVALPALLILGIFAGCQGGSGPCGCYAAPIVDVDILPDESSPLPPLQYLLHVVSGCFTCDDFSRKQVTSDYPTISPTILVDILNCTCNLSCPPDRPPDSYVTWNISLNHYVVFYPGETYTITVNHNETMNITFVADSAVTTYLAPIQDIEIWADNSSPPQYFVGVVSEEHSFCDHFDSYNVTPAGNTTITVEIFNLMCSTNCTLRCRNVEHTIPLGSDFVTGGNYTVVVNNMTETFVA
jgi:hypothetical protein